MKRAYKVPCLRVCQHLAVPFTQNLPHNWIEYQYIVLCHNPIFKWLFTFLTKPYSTTRNAVTEIERVSSLYICLAARGRTNSDSSKGALPIVRCKVKERKNSMLKVKKNLLLIYCQNLKKPKYIRNVIRYAWKPTSRLFMSKSG